MADFRNFKQSDIPKSQYVDPRDISPQEKQIVRINGREVILPSLPSLDSIDDLVIDSLATNNLIADTSNSIRNSISIPNIIHTSSIPKTTKFAPHLLAALSYFALQTISPDYLHAEQSHAAGMVKTKVPAKVGEKQDETYKGIEFFDKWYFGKKVEEPKKKYCEPCEPTPQPQAKKAVKPKKKKQIASQKKKQVEIAQVKQEPRLQYSQPIEKKEYVEPMQRLPSCYDKQIYVLDGISGHIRDSKVSITSIDDFIKIVDDLRVYSNESKPMSGFRVQDKLDAFKVINPITGGTKNRDKRNDGKIKIYSREDCKSAYEIDFDNDADDNLGASSGSNFRNDLQKIVCSSDAIAVVRTKDQGVAIVAMPKNGYYNLTDIDVVNYGSFFGQPKPSRVSVGKRGCPTYPVDILRDSMSETHIKTMPVNPGTWTYGVPSINNSITGGSIPGPVRTQTPFNRSENNYKKR